MHAFHHRQSLLNLLDVIFSSLSHVSSTYFRPIWGSFVRVLHVPAMSYFTVRLSVVECCNWFEVPVTETEYVPAGVPGLLGALAPPPPHETTGTARQISNAQEAMPKPTFLPVFLARAAANEKRKTSPSQKAMSGVLGTSCQGIGKAEEDAVVEIVSVEVDAPDPGVTLAGEKLQDASDGKPEQAKETEFEKVPYFSPTLTVYVADWPGETLALVCVLVTVKSDTVICTLLVGKPAVAPPLLTVRVSVSLPVGQFTEGFAPVAFPQLPPQVMVRGQLSGSVPLPLSVTVAPLVLAAFTVCAVPAFALGIAALTAANALSNPYPSMSFGTSCEIPGSGEAVLVRKFLKSARAVAAVFTLELGSKHWAACRTSAATAAA